MTHDIELPMVRSFLLEPVGRIEVPGFEHFSSKGKFRTGGNQAVRVLHVGDNMPLIDRDEVGVAQRLLRVHRMLATVKLDALVSELGPIERLAVAHAHVWELTVNGGQFSSSKVGHRLLRRNPSVFLTLGPRGLPWGFLVQVPHRDMGLAINPYEATSPLFQKGRYIISG